MKETESMYESINGSTTKRAKSIAAESSPRRKFGTMSRSGAQGRMHTAGSSGGSPDRHCERATFFPAASSYEKFRRKHPQYFEGFVNGMGGSF